MSASDVQYLTSAYSGHPRTWDMGRINSAIAGLSKEERSTVAQAIGIRGKETGNGDSSIHGRFLGRYETYSRDQRDGGSPFTGAGVLTGRKAWGDALRDMAKRKAVMGLSAGATGGYAVPPEVALRIDEGLKEVGVFHQLAMQQEMTTFNTDVPSLDLNQGHATGASPLFGAMQLSGFNENPTALPESEPTFSNASLQAGNIGCLVYASNQLVDDGGEPLAKFLEWQFTQAIEFAVELQCFSGTTPGLPVGITQSAATATVTRQTGGTVAIQDIGGMIASLLPASFRRAVWACSVTALSKIVQMTNSFQVSDNANNQNGLVGHIAGRPMYATEKLPAVGTQGDVMLFDPKLYVLGRRSLEIGASRETKAGWEKYQTIYRLWWRGGGQPIPKGTITLADGTTKVGAFVALK